LIFITWMNRFGGFLFDLLLIVKITKILFVLFTISLYSCSKPKQKL